ncbi:VanW family protein [Bacillus sp. SG-1]|uniref:VanW family protein n=1 Tax=Bacillus sp. SG-1 TaxID=161544 RepID=UPI00015440C9|nr:VanW family protein [Bacillus sp. SG-1]EDL65940.1 YoaR [Bacillus sp. SG-1]
MKFLLSFLIAVQMNTAPIQLELVHEGKTIASINRSEYETMPFPEYIINQQQLDALISDLNQHLSRQPINAKLDDNNQIISEHNGKIVDKEKFKSLFYSAFYKNKPVTLDIPFKTVYPKVDSELLEKINRKRISHYVTYFNSRNKDRVHNIKLASQAINNYVVFPGETFSFNRVVGKRTVSKGYLPAPVIVKGELSEGVGGGICQVSSTLFNAVDRAGVKIMERYSHSRRVPYVPPKRDATVSWYGPDFTFKNQHNQPLLIRSRVVGGQMIIMVFSSEDIDYNRKNVPSVWQYQAGN